MNSSKSILMVFCFVLLGITLISGCGYKEYAKRERKAAEHYQFISLMDSALNRTPVADNKLVMRAPLQFTYVAKKAPPKKSEEDRLDSGESFDNRQPDYLDDYEFPGLIGAWETPVNVNIGGAAKTRTAHLYAVSNFQIWATRRSEEKTAGIADPKTFLSDFIVNLAEKLGVKVDNKDKGLLNIPDKNHEKYASPRSYETLTFLPVDPIQDVEMEFQIWLYQDGDVQAALILVMPKENDQKAGIQSGMKLALYTFEAFKPGNASMESDTPTAGNKPAKPPAAAAGF